jgi:hypothetical protein
LHRSIIGFAPYPMYKSRSKSSCNELTNSTFLSLKSLYIFIMYTLYRLAIALAIAVPIVHCNRGLERCSGLRGHGTVLYANCDTGNGRKDTHIDLNTCFANDNGNIVVSTLHQCILFTVAD